MAGPHVVPGTDKAHERRGGPVGARQRDVEKRYLNNVSGPGSRWSRASLLVCLSCHLQFNCSLDFILFIPHYSARKVSLFAELAGH